MVAGEWNVGSIMGKTVTPVILALHMLIYWLPCVPLQELFPTQCSMLSGSTAVRKFYDAGMYGFSSWCCLTSSFVVFQSAFLYSLILYLLYFMYRFRGCTANVVPMKILYKCLVLIYVFTEI
jgi:hypothetical protein